MSRRWEEFVRAKARYEAQGGDAALQERIAQAAKDDPSGAVTIPIRDTWPSEIPGDPPIASSLDYISADSVALSIRCGTCGEVHTQVRRSVATGQLLLLRGARPSAVLGAHPYHRFAFECCGKSSLVSEHQLLTAVEEDRGTVRHPRR